jgi:cold shock protein
MSRRAKATVIWFRGNYGFLKPEHGDKNIFVHRREVERAGLDNLLEGQIIEYELDTRKGRQSATNLKVHTTPVRWGEV